MTSAAVALREERAAHEPRVAIARMPEVGEAVVRTALSAKIALATIVLVQVGWLAALGYFAFSVVR